MLDARSWDALTTLNRAGFMGKRRMFSEFRAVELLREEGQEAAAPVLRILRRASRHARRKEIAAAPLLPGYVFLRAPRPPSSSQLKRWPHICGVVKIGLEAARLPTEQVAALLRLDGTERPLTGELPYDASGKCIAGGGLARRELKPGDQAVHVPTNQIGTVEALDREQAILLFEFLGGLRRVSVQSRDLEYSEGLRML